MPSQVADLARAFESSGLDLPALGLAWGRMAPTVALVPAFGLRALPLPVRGVFGVTLAVAVAPALSPRALAHAAEPWPLLLVEELLRGLPLALAAAIPLWAATMAGGVIDGARASSDQVSAPTVEGKATVLGVPFSLLACAIFLAMGGPSRVALTLASLDDAVPPPLLAATLNLVNGIRLAVAIGAPLMVASVVIEVGTALVARAASPSQVHALLAPLRSLSLLAVLGLVFDRLAVVMAEAVNVR